MNLTELLVKLSTSDDAEIDLQIDRDFLSNPSNLNLVLFDAIVETLEYITIKKEIRLRINLKDLSSINELHIMFLAFLTKISLCFAKHNMKPIEITICNETSTFNIDINLIQLLFNDVAQSELAHGKFYIIELLETLYSTPNQLYSTHIVELVINSPSSLRRLNFLSKGINTFPVPALIEMLKQGVYVGFMAGNPNYNKQEKLQLLHAIIASGHVIDADDCNLDQDEFYQLIDKSNSLALPLASRYVQTTPDILLKAPDNIKAKIREYLLNDVSIPEAWLDILHLVPLSLEEQRKVSISILSANIHNNLFESKRFIKANLEVRVCVIKNLLKQDPEYFDHICDPFRGEPNDYGRIGTVIIGPENEYFSPQEDTGAVVPELRTTQLLNIAQDLLNKLVVATDDQPHPLAEILQSIIKLSYDSDDDYPKINKLLGWVYYAAILIAEHQGHKIQSRFLKEIYNFADPAKKYTLTDDYFELFKSNDASNLLSANEKHFTGRMILPAIYIVKLCGNDKELFLRTLKLICSSYKDNANMKYFINALMKISSNAKMSNASKICLVQDVLSLPSITIQKSRWIIIDALAGADRLHLLAGCLNFEHALDATYKTILAEMFDLSPLQVETFSSNIADYAKQALIISYNSNLQKLSKDDRDLYMTLLKRFIHLLSTPRSSGFYEARYDVNTNVHLKTIFSKHPNLKAAWRLNYLEPMTTVMDRVARSSNLDLSIRTIIADSIKNKHINLDEASPELRASIHALLNIPDDQVDMQIQILKNIITKTNAAKHPMFKQDCISILNGVRDKKRTKKLDYANYTVIDTDDYWRLFMTGTDVPDSCQNILGSPFLNRALIGGYVLSGHIRQISVIDKHDKLIARAMLRLVWDEDTQNHALILEEVYPRYVSTEFMNAITQVACIRALIMDCHLLIKSKATSDAQPKLDQYHNPVAVLFGYGVEYVDSLHSQQQFPYKFPPDTLDILQKQPSLLPSFDEVKRQSEVVVLKSTLKYSCLY
jgi:hypothetical protein